MKTILVIFTLLIGVQLSSATANDYNPFQISEATTILPIVGTSILISGCKNICHKEAVQIVDDSQIYMQTGVLTLFIESQINAIKSNNQDLSTDEAFDILLTAAETAL